MLGLRAPGLHDEGSPDHLSLPAGFPPTGHLQPELSQGQSGDTDHVSSGQLGYGGQVQEDPCCGPGSRNLGSGTW